MATIDPSRGGNALGQMQNYVSRVGDGAANCFGRTFRDLTAARIANVERENHAKKRDSSTQRPSAVNGGADGKTSAVTESRVDTEIAGIGGGNQATTSPRSAWHLPVCS